MAYIARKSLQALRGEAVRNRIKKYVSNNPDCKIVVSTSGGKDSAALLAWAVRLWGPNRIEAVHADLNTDWVQTIPVVKAQCKKLGVKVTIVGREDKKGMLDLLVGGQISRKTKKRVQRKWAGRGAQWCTSQLKVQPLDKFCKSLGDNILVLIGERAEESRERARKHVWKKVVFPRLKKVMVKCSPLYDWSVDRVWAEADSLGLPKHPAYKMGFSRASCVICIFSKKKEIALAAKVYPELVNKYLAAEKKIDHKFKPKQTIADILKEQGIKLNKKGEVA